MKTGSQNDDLVWHLGDTECHQCHITLTFSPWAWTLPQHDHEIVFTTRAFSIGDIGGIRVSPVFSTLRKATHEHVTRKPNFSVKCRFR